MKTFFSFLLALTMGLLMSNVGVAQCGSGSSGSSSSSVGSSGTVGNLNSLPGSFNFRDFSSRISSGNSIASQTYSRIESSYAEMEGSPLLYDRFVDATLVLNNDTELPLVKVNYDGHLGDIIAMDENGDKIILDSRYYKRVIVDDREHFATFEKPNSKKGEKFYQVLYDKNGLVFYKDPEVTLRDGTNNGIVRTAPRFSKGYRYYVINGGSDPIAVNLKKKDLFDHFPDIELVAMQEIIKKNKYKMNKESDYMALFAQL